jgi:membrane-bound lytic murein transglycosylase D
LSAERSYLVLAFLTIFVSLVSFAAPVRAGEKETFSTPLLSGVLSVPPVSGKEAPAVPGPLSLSDPGAAASEEAKAVVPVSPLVPQGQGALSSPAEKEEKGSDLVLSPKDVEGEIARNEEPEAVEELDRGFFTNAPDEVEKGREGSYAGLSGRIEKFIRYFQTKGRDRFEVWLARSGKYSDMMRGILAKYGLPGDLVYLALIESGFSPKAYSVARAAGPWQFITGTARRYGLRVDWWADERRDYEKATHAAASYLKDLYGMFESWPLATAAYNAGEGKIQRAVARYKSDDISELIRHRYLARETKDYVPKMLAALTIAKDPDKYGFGDVRYEEPLDFDKVVIPGGTDLAALGEIIGVPPDSLKEWNPELKRFCTPPNTEMYEIRLPKGFGPVAEERMDDIRSDAKVIFLLHHVRKGETLVSLSSRYGTPVNTLKEINGLRRDSLQRVSRLVIPVTGLSPEDSVPGKEISPARLVLAHMKIEEGLRRGQKVRVRSGDTLGKIAKRTGVSVKELAQWNGMKTTGILRAGTVITIPRRGAVSRGARSTAAPGDGGGFPHVVRSGESLGGISRAHGVPVETLAEANHLDPDQPLRKGRVLLIPTES